MRLSHQIALNLFEAAEGIGVRRAQLTEPLGLDAKALADPRTGLDWNTFVLLLARLDELVDGDVERIREVGTKMVGVPSFGVLQRLARAVFSVKSVYLAGERWVASADVPHLVMRTTFPTEDRMHFTCSIPEPYAASKPSLHVFEGLLCAVPTMMGLPPATIEKTVVTPRELEIVLALPSSRSVVARMMDFARATVRLRDVLDVVEGQRREVAEGLEAARRSTAEIVTLFDRLPVLVVIHRAGEIVWLNRAAAKTLGFDDTTRVVGRPFAEFFHPSSHDLANERIFGEVDGGGAPDLVEAELAAPDGSRVLVEVSPTETVFFGGKEARLFVARDVTERRRLERQLSIADRLASIGMLAAGVAHEVNNPLAYVLNSIEIAQRELSPLGGSADASRAALDVALEGVGRIRATVRELLALARVEQDPIGHVDVRKVVESTLALARPQISERAELVCELKPTPPVMATASRIGQVLLNLIANALEAMSPADRATNVLRLVVRPSAPHRAVIEVSDTGVGIAPEHEARVFEPFFTTKSAGNGTGLGLAISQRLIAEVGGELSFESKERLGTTFRVTLRTAEEA
jgi:PAS domain S-box-containing protein